MTIHITHCHWSTVWLKKISLVLLFPSWFTTVTCCPTQIPFIFTMLLNTLYLFICFTPCLTLSVFANLGKILYIANAQEPCSFPVQEKQHSEDKTGRTTQNMQCRQKTHYGKRESGNTAAGWGGVKTSRQGQEAERASPPTFTLSTWFF